jgi:histidyl-tRNA synthetase
MLADAEIVAVIYEALRRLGFTDFVISINNRKLLDGIGQYAGVPEALQAGLYRSIDKLDKIGLEGVRRELLMVGVPADPIEPLQRVARLAIQGKLANAGMRARMVDGEGLDPALADGVLEPLQRLVTAARDKNIAPGALQAATRELVGELAPRLRDYYASRAEIIPAEVVDRLLDLLQISGPPADVLADLGARLADYPRAVEGITELRDLFAYLDALGVPEQAVELNFAMVRGLEYYTGPIFETTIREPKAMPSITGGGRYDELIGMFSDVSYPATGTSLGIERIIDAMDELGMFPPGIRATTAEVLVTVFDASTLGESLKLATALRREGINTSLYFDYEDRLGDQIGYAAAKGIPFVVILGPDEVRAGQATIRALGETRTEGDQRTVPIEKVAQAIREW